MSKFLGIACSIALALAVADVGTGKAPADGITVAQVGKGKAPIGKGKAPIGYGKGKAPPPVVTKG